MPLSPGLGVERGMKCFTFQIHHPVLGLYLAPALPGVLLWAPWLQLPVVWSCVTYLLTPTRKWR